MERKEAFQQITVRLLKQQSVALQLDQGSNLMSNGRYSQIRGIWRYGVMASCGMHISNKEI